MGKFRVTISHLPTMVCKKGCSSFYWYHPDLAEEIVAIITRDASKWAKHGAAVNANQVCRIDGQELQEGGLTTFRFEKIPLINRGALALFPRPFTRPEDAKPAATGAEGKILVILNAPSLVCPLCDAHYLPLISGENDPYYMDLFKTIRKAITQDFIYDESAFTYWQ